MGLREQFSNFDINRDYSEFTSEELKLENKMIFLQGSKVSFRCDCQCNVFKEIKPLKYKCNSCGTTYTGER